MLYLWLLKAFSNRLPIWHRGFFLRASRLAYASRQRQVIASLPVWKKTTLFITLKIENRRPEQIQIDQWGVNTTKSRVGYTQVFDLNTFTVFANADCEVTEKIDDDIAHALPEGAEVFCETATGETVTASLKVPAFPRKTVG